MISHLFYADDLVLLSYTPIGLQCMLDELRKYSNQKGLVVNASKSKVMVFNVQYSSVQNVEFRYAGQPLAVVEEFKYLGLVFRSNQSGLRVEDMQEPWSRALFGSIRRVHKIALEFGVKKSVWAVLRLFQTYGMSTGMYGCQVWGTRYAELSEVFKSDVARRHMCFLRRTAGVARSIANWVVLAELNCRPYHFYWIRALLKFHKSLLSCNNPILADVVKADAWLASQEYLGVRCVKCWSAEFAAGLSSIAREDGKKVAWVTAVRGATELDAPSVLSDLKAAYEELAWKGCSDIHDVRVSNLTAADGSHVGRMHATYHAWFRMQQPTLPPYLWSPVTKHRQVMNMLRFRMGSHGLGCNVGRRVFPEVPWADRLCSRCSDEHRATLLCAVDDEYHAIFECEAFEALRDSASVRDSITGAHGDVRAFIFSGNLSCVMKYISAIMDMVDGEA